MCPWHLLLEKTKSICQQFKTPLFENGRAIPYEKCHFFLKKVFLVNELSNPTSNFIYVEACFLSIG
jgi:hypothetical protein